jgi:GNAT superfamily N-acetyltransferase
MQELLIRKMLPHEAEAAASLIGKSFCNNPLFVRIFGSEKPLHRQEAIMRLYLTMLHRYLARDHVFGAFYQGTLAGAAVLIYPGNCRPPPVEKLQILHSLIIGNSARMTMGALQWLRFWVRHDPAETHWHIGPVVTDPGFQTLGIGTLLMKEVCRVIDAAKEVAHLEADTPEAVRFYSRFGFHITDEEVVHGVPTWFMSRG